MLDPSALNSLNTLSALSPLFNSVFSRGFANPAQLVASADTQLAEQNSFPSQQALALSGLFTQALGLQNAAAQLSFSSLANSFLDNANSTVLPLRPFSQTTASSSNPTAVTASALPGATLTSYTVGVSQLATPQVNAGSLLTSTQNSPIKSGAIDVTVGTNATQTVTYNVRNNSDNEAALEAVASALNQANAGITATVNFDSVNNTSQLVLTSDTQGTAGAFTVADHNPPGTSNAISQSGTGSATTAAQDALYSVNGVGYNLTSGNSFTLDNGKVNVNLLGTTASATVTVASSTGSLAGQVTSLVNAYNDFHDYLATNSATINAGLLQQLNGIVNAHTAELQPLGITVASDGSLAVNQTTLSSISQTTPNQVESVLAGPNGLATQLKGLAAEVGVGLQNVFAAAIPATLDTSSLPTRLAGLFGDILLADASSSGSLINIHS